MVTRSRKRGRAIASELGVKCSMAGSGLPYPNGESGLLTNFNATPANCGLSCEMLSRYEFRIALLHGTRGVFATPGGRPSPCQPGPEIVRGLAPMAPALLPVFQNPQWDSRRPQIDECEQLPSSLSGLRPFPRQ